MSRYHQTAEDLQAHLGDQIQFMVESAKSYDQGFEGEAKRLATAIRVLVHDTTQSNALLTQLGRIKETLFYDSATDFDPNNLTSSNCLTTIKVGKREGEEQVGAEYVALLDRVHSGRSTTKRVGFERWWRRSIIYRDLPGREFSRRDLVRAVADQDGGVHVDPVLQAEYADLSRFNSLGWKLVVNDEPKDFNNNPVPPSIRQIAHEVLKTVKDISLQLFPNDDPVFKVFRTYEEHCAALTL
ncbi:MAG: hypothetical protein ISS55_08540 [Dehalococcoidales bacterium]|nr:hypothetical protein [Dehalococcoidales bacterium]